MSEESTVSSTPASDAAGLGRADNTPFGGIQDRGKLENSVGDALAKFNASSGIDPIESEPETEVDETPDGEEAVTQDEAPESKATEPMTPEADSEESEADEDRQPDEKPVAKADKKAPTIPAAWRRSLKAYEWTDEEIDAAAKENPTGFLTIAQKAHNSRVAETQRWAELGRATKAAEAQKSTAGGPKGAVEAAPKGAIEALNADQMVEKFGNEEVTRAIVDHVNSALKPVFELLPDLRVGVEDIRRSREQALGKQIDEFFTGKDMETYAEVYGKDAKTITEAQIQKRNGVLEMADALVAGAAQQGRQLSVSEALALAHDSMSASYSKQAVRQEIKKAVKARAGGISIRPGGNKRSDPSAPPRDRSDLEARTRSRLASVFGG